MVIKAEYIWIDGTEPTARLRSKTKVLDGRRRARIFRSGASTVRARTRRRAEHSDCVLRPVLVYPDPIRGGDNVLVLCEVLLTDMTPHATNTRAAAAPSGREVRRPGAAVRHRAGVHVLQGRPPARLPRGGFPAPQGFYYCGVGADEVFGRDVVEAHLEACLDAGLGISASTPRSCPASGSSRSGRSVRSRCPTSCGWRGGCSTASPRTSASPRPSTPSRSRATGTAPAPTPTSRPRRCASATSRSSPRARRSASAPASTSRTTVSASKSASPACTRPRRGTSSATASPTGGVGAHPVAGRGRRQGLHRGPAPQRQHGPVHRHPAHHRHGLQRASCSAGSSSGREGRSRTWRSGLRMTS